MGAVSYLLPTKEVIEYLSNDIDITKFSAGYFDDWGSEFKLSLENGKIVLNFSTLGGYLIESAYNGWWKDTTIRSVIDREFSGVFSQWHENYPEIQDINYLIINNEVIAVGQCGLILWMKSESSIDELKELCYSAKKDFFDYEWEIPTHLK